MAQRLVVGVVTFCNAPAHLGRLAESFALARGEVGGGWEVVLTCTDNGPESGLARLVPGAVAQESQGNVGFAAAAGRLMRHAFAELGAEAFVCANPDGAFHHRTLHTLLEYSRRFP